VKRALALLALAVARAFAAGGPSAPTQSPAAQVRGLYRVHGTMRVAAGQMLDGASEVHADVTLEPGGGPLEVRVRVASQGYACDLVGRLADDGALDLAAGQRCTLDLRPPDARGRVEGTLRPSRGRVREDQLELELAADVSGTLSLRTGGRVEVLGNAVDLPEGWTPMTPVRGEARATVQGTRDRSRAAGP
jgi:hypothetical protein